MTQIEAVSQFKIATNPAYHIAAHHAAFSTSAFCKVQLILRRCGSEAELRSDSEAAELECVEQPRVPHRSPPRKFLGVAICLILRCCGSGVAELEAWSGVECRVAHRSPPRRFFSKCILQGAIDFAEAADAKRSCGVRGAECCTFFGVACFAPNPNF
ncbi:MAG: hypothetical protein WA977_13570 [Halobacteriota archaeon]